MKTNIGEAPVSGTGLHQWILDQTRVLSGQGYNRDWILAAVYQKAQGKGRMVNETEVQVALDDAIEWYERHGWICRSNGSWQRSKLPFDQWLEQQKAKSGQRLGIRRPPAPAEWKQPVDRKLVSQALKMRKRTLVSRRTLNLANLYAGLNYAICLAKQAAQPEIRLVSEWRQQQLTNYQYMSPNPFLRCGFGIGTKIDANAGERLWIIAEFDQGSIEEQLQKLFWLDQAAELDLALVVFSGGKSLHGWFSVVGLRETVCCRWFRLATSIGADPGMQSSIQYTRFPGGLNQKSGKRQEIIHWEAAAIEQHNVNLLANRV